MAAGRDMRGIYAYPNHNGTYRLIAFSGSTYHMREKIKSLGGTWDGHFWSVPESALASLPKVRRMVEAEHDGYCHEPAGRELVEESELAAGMTRSGFCGLCDSHCGPYPVRHVDSPPATVAPKHRART